MQSTNFAKVVGVLPVAVVVLAGGCVSAPPVTGTRTPFDPVAFSQVSNIGILVDIQPLEATVAREKKYKPDVLTYVAFFTLSPVLAAIDGAIAGANQTSKDAQLTRDLQGLMLGLDSRKLIQDSLISHLLEGKVAPSISPVETLEPQHLKDRNVQAVFVVKVLRWGLCARSDDLRDTQVHVGLSADLKIVAAADHKVMWERQEFYVDGNSHPLEEFRNSPDLLQERARDTLDNYCARTANYIISVIAARRGSHAPQ